MRILNLDLDFFLQQRATDRTGKGRLSADYTPWSELQVRDFLTKNCGLSTSARVRGGLVTEHHELFDTWKQLIDAGIIQIPFELTHVDAHADMGMGDASCGYIMGELVHHDWALRTTPRRGGHDGLLAGNFLSFAIACRWISSITYVYHPCRFRENLGKHDIPDDLFKASDWECGTIQLRQLPRAYWGGHATSCGISIARIRAGGSHTSRGL